MLYDAGQVKSKKMTIEEYAWRNGESVESQNFGWYAAGANVAKRNYLFGLARFIGLVKHGMFLGEKKLKNVKNALAVAFTTTHTMSKIQTSGIEESSQYFQIVYQRTTETNNSTTGTFAIPGTFISGYILEPAGPSTTLSGTDRRIPSGIYNLMLNDGEVPGLKLFNAEVSQDRGILIHIGNYPGDTTGCLLPGSSLGVDLVGGSTNAFEQLMNHFDRVRIIGAQIVIRDITVP